MDRVREIYIAFEKVFAMLAMILGNVFRRV